MAIGKAPLSVDDIVARQRAEKEAASKVGPSSLSSLISHPNTDSSRLYSQNS